MSKQMERGRPFLNRGLPAQWLFVTGSQRLQACLELWAGRVAAGQEDGWVLRATHCPLLVPLAACAWHHGNCHQIDWFHAWAQEWLIPPAVHSAENWGHGRVPKT